MSTLILQQPKRLFFGPGCISGIADELNASSLNRVFVVTNEGAPAEMAESQANLWKTEGIDARIFDGINKEPDLALFNETLEDFTPIITEYTQAC